MLAMFSHVASVLYSFFGVAPDAAASSCEPAVTVHTRKQARRKRMEAQAVLTTHKRSIAKRATATARKRATATAQKNANGKRAWDGDCTKEEWTRDSMMYEEYCELRVACSFNRYHLNLIAKTAASKPF